MRDVVERVPMGFVFSLDAVSKDLYESIRVGADFESVKMANVEMLRVVAAGHGGTICSINFCLMAQNYQGFGDVLLFIEERGMKVDVTALSANRRPRVRRRWTRLAIGRLTGGVGCRDGSGAAAARRSSRGVGARRCRCVGAWAGFGLRRQLDAATDTWGQLRPTRPRRIRKLERPWGWACPTMRRQCADLAVVGPMESSTRPHGRRRRHCD